MTTNAPAIDPVALFGQMDIYILDQVLRGRIAPGMRLLDAGAGSGRNLAFFLGQGYDVQAFEPNTGAIAALRALAARRAPRLPAADFRQETAESNTFPDRAAQVVISSAVLHFARDEANFAAMLHGTWRLVSPGGLLFCRLASTIGMEGRFTPLGGRRFLLPGGTDWFLVDEAYLLDLTARLGAQLLDPIKTTVVQGQRCMTTWVLRNTKPF
jgi:tellurite methyltransferase